MGVPVTLLAFVAVGAVSQPRCCPYPVGKGSQKGTEQLCPAKGEWKLLGGIFEEEALTSDPCPYHMPSGQVTGGGDCPDAEGTFQVTAATWQHPQQEQQLALTLSGGNYHPAHLTAVACPLQGDGTAGASLTWAACRMGTAAHTGWGPGAVWSPRAAPGASVGLSE